MNQIQWEDVQKVKQSKLWQEYNEARSTYKIEKIYDPEKGAQPTR